MVDFQWFNALSYFGLLKITHDGSDCVHLFFRSLQSKKIYIHLDSSCTETFNAIAFSHNQKIGIIIADSGNQVKWFDLGGSQCEDVTEGKGNALDRVEDAHPDANIITSSVKDNVENEIVHPCHSDAVVENKECMDIDNETRKSPRKRKTSNT
ncbi:hypothetical protein AB6A40_008598 [Gnathostoma spinigerum]|uniref:Uncharacterized protein n=1 Tax=Gnathostoma spinigerum TaxID=75299 RepID=A0ABD6EXA6_9BILA